MVASSRLTLDVKPFQAIEKGIDSVPDAVYAIADEATDYADRNNLPAIREYPPRLAVHPFEFATEKSRRFYFAVIVPRLGNSGRYERTGGLKNSWKTVRQRGNGVYSATLQSNKQWALFVVGNLARQRQVAGHQNTGWQYVAPKIENWQSDLLSQFFKLYEDRVGNLSELSIR
jgi:hypothetical protein